MDIAYTFAGSAGQHVTFAVSASSWTNGTVAGSAYLVLYNPAGNYAGEFALNQSPTFGDFNLTSTGTWQVVVDPQSTSVGHTTFTFAHDVALRTLTSGSAVSTSISFRGQNAQFQFAGSSGQHITFDVSASAWADGGTAGTAYLVLYDPAGNYAGEFVLHSGVTFGDFRLTSTGTWRAILDPQAGATGHATFTFARDVPVVALTSATAVDTTIALRGQNALYQFAGSTGQHISFDVSTSSWHDGVADGSAYLVLYDPAGNYRGEFPLNQSPTFGDFALTSTGTWRAILDPQAGATGHATVTLANDVALATLAGGVPVTTTIGLRGQNALYQFAGSAGQHITFDVSASSWHNGAADGSAYLVLYDPAGNYRGEFLVNESATFGDFNLTSTGTWRLILDPQAAATGHIKFTFAHDVAVKTLTLGTPVSTTISLRGQNALYQFSGSTGQRLTVNVTASAWQVAGVNGSAYLSVYDPDGNYRGAFALNQSPTSGPLTLDRSGTWRLVLDPNADAVGHATFVLLAAPAAAARPQPAAHPSPEVHPQPARSTETPTTCPCP